MSNEMRSDGAREEVTSARTFPTTAHKAWSGSERTGTAVGLGSDRPPTDQEFHSRGGVK
jgi:hypothetical protein